MSHTSQVGVISNKYKLFAAMAKNPLRFKHASRKLRSDREVCLFAVKRNAKNFKYVDVNAECYVDILSKALERNPLIKYEVDPTLLERREVTMAIAKGWVKHHGKYLSNDHFDILGTSFLADEEIVRVVSRASQRVVADMIEAGHKPSRELCIDLFRANPAEFVPDPVIICVDRVTTILNYCQDIEVTKRAFINGYSFDELGAAEVIGRYEENVIIKIMDDIGWDKYPRLTTATRTLQKLAVRAVTRRHENYGHVVIKYDEDVIQAAISQPRNENLRLVPKDVLREDHIVMALWNNPSSIVDVSIGMANLRVLAAAIASPRIKTDIDDVVHYAINIVASFGCQAMLDDLIRTELLPINSFKEMEDIVTVMSLTQHEINCDGPFYYLGVCVQVYLIDMVIPPDVAEICSYYEDPFN